MNNVKAFFVVAQLPEERITAFVCPLHVTTLEEAKKYDLSPDVLGIYEVLLNKDSDYERLRELAPTFAVLMELSKPMNNCEIESLFGAHFQEGFRKGVVCANSQNIPFPDLKPCETLFADDDGRQEKQLASTFRALMALSKLMRNGEIKDLFSLFIGEGFRQGIAYANAQKSSNIPASLQPQALSLPPKAGRQTFDDDDDF